MLALDKRRVLSTAEYAWSWALCKFLDSHPRWHARFRQLAIHVRDPQFNQRFREEFHDQVGFGQMPDRPYEERQRVPGDWDAQVTIGPAGRHSRERLGWADQGIIMLRRRLRQAIQDLEAGRDPTPDAYRGNTAIRTHSRDWVLESPPTGSSDRDIKVSNEIAERFVANIIAYSQEGINFLFGPIGDKSIAFIFAFNVLPSVNLSTSFDIRSPSNGNLPLNSVG